MMKRNVGTLLLLAMVLAPSAAHAVIESGDSELQGQIGIYQTWGKDGADDFSILTGLLGYGKFFGTRNELGIRVNANWALAGEFNSKSIDPELFWGYHWNREGKRTIPFIEFAVGATFTTSSSNDGLGGKTETDDTLERVAFSFGIKHFLNSYAALTFRWQHVVSNFDDIQHQDIALFGASIFFGR